MVNKNGIYRASYWCKINKKNIWKAYNIKKFDNDEQKIKEALDVWKKEEHAKMEENYKQLLENKSNAIIDEPLEEVKIEPLKETIELPIKNDGESIIKYSTFNLKIASKEEGGTSTILFGSSKSGKTYQLMKIINKYYDNNKFIVFLMADSIHNSPAYKNLPKNIIKLDHFDTDLIERIHHIQKQTNNKYRFVFITDDIILEKNNTMILRMLLTYRNADISTVMLLQSTTLLSKNGRFNINNAIFRRNNNAEAVEQTIRFFIGGYEPFYSLRNMEEKINLYREATKDYAFIYLDALNDELTFHK